MPDDGNSALQRSVANKIKIMKNKLLQQIDFNRTDRKRYIVLLKSLAKFSPVAPVILKAIWPKLWVGSLTQGFSDCLIKVTSVHGKIFYFYFPTFQTKFIRLQKVVKNSPAIAVLAPRTLLIKRTLSGSTGRVLRRNNGFSESIQ